MIVILSSSSDFSTSQVIDWLLFYKAGFVRLSDEDALDIQISLTNESGPSDTTITCPGKDPISFAAINTYWYRRGFVRNTYSPLSGNNPQSTYISRFIFEEHQAVNEALNALFKSDINHLGAFKDNFLNKLDVLNAARRLGLQIPNTLVTTQKKDIESFIERFPKCITKAITNGFTFKIKETTYFLHTIALDATKVEGFPERFPSILVQEQLPKKYELRIFFLKDKFYSSVIFSQNDPKTSLDFRNYNNEKPNRVCPFTLPETIEQNLRNLMQHFDIKTGSIDLVVTEDDRFVFLEVNPIGQFRQVSNPCNYYLEEKIAKTLIDYGEKTVRAIA